MSKQEVLARIKATDKKRSRKFCNTRVAPYREDDNQKVAVTLFGNSIANFNLTKGTFTVSNGGWRSNTSRDWMRELMHEFKEASDERGLFIRKGEWYIRDPMKKLPDRKRRKFDKDTPQWRWNEPQTFKIREGAFPHLDVLRKRLPQDVLEMVHSYI